VKGETRGARFPLAPSDGERGVVKDFVLSPDKSLLPAYRISPFQTADIARNRALPFSATIDEYFQQRFSGRHFIYCESGRYAIHLALATLKLGPQDVVTILTTTGNFYISGCVTREIEKFCRWSREIEPQTKALLVNHEFGFPYEELRALRRFNVPIIEDAAHAFASNNREQSAGQVGDFVVYSFPKFFPIQTGGLLVFNEDSPAREVPGNQYVQKVLSAHIDNLSDAAKKRRENYHALTTRFQQLGCTPRFQLTENSVPGVFMFQTPAGVDLPALKTFVQEHGIESSVFYGEQAFFVPVHERLAPADLDYFAQVVSGFLTDRQ
jgi:dTDP-4-amino-4,6-dideoxygalactose transaminase